LHKNFQSLFFLDASLIDGKLNFFFKNQIWHIGGLIILFYLGYHLVDFENNLTYFLELVQKIGFCFL